MKSFRFFAVCSLAAASFMLAPQRADAAGICRFPPQPPVILKNMGPCNFDPEQLRFAGEPDDQARCLLTPVMKFGKLGQPLERLPAVFAGHVGRTTDLPDRVALAAYLRAQDLERDFGAFLERPVARARDGEPDAPLARYFVIHDTSSPNFGARALPHDIDRDRAINNLSRYECANKIERAHVFINRTGRMLLGHELDTPWRATKFEMAVLFGTALKGLFLHVELVQPRQREPGRGANNDFRAPMPGFSPAQYERLALVYAIASVRAGAWLIPAFHAVIDEGIYDKHDDPQNFELERFAVSLQKVLADLRKTPSQ
jgi:hypothetical protein